MTEVRLKSMNAKKAASAMNDVTPEQKNEALLRMADLLTARADFIIDANAKDLDQGKQQGTTAALLDRLALNEERVEGIAESLRQIAQLPDQMGDVLETITRPNGLHIEKVRVPLGVVGMIYEARPNVTIDAAGLCLKTNNAVVLRGGSAALQSNKAIVHVLHEALRLTTIPVDMLQLIESVDRASVKEMLQLNGWLDVIIPRGGASLIQRVIQQATIPVIETGAGICHTYIDKSADPDMAEAIAFNAKVQRPSVCNAMETLLVHEQFAERHLTGLLEGFETHRVQLRGCAQTITYAPWAQQATTQDYGTEYNDYVLNVRVVRTLSEALDHIAQYGTKHSECIVTENKERAQRFLNEVDAAAVYHNASTRFTDGFEFGLGAEIGTSTQKLHARGPMGLQALTSTKYRIYGKGQIRE